MTQEFIKYEQALALKELGFDEPCLGFYNHQGKFIIMSQENEEEISTWNNNYAPLGKQYATPLKSQAFRWFREKHNLYSEILVDQTMEPIFVFTIHTHLWGDKHLSEYLYRTYEEAEQACLEKLIEIVKTNKD